MQVDNFVLTCFVGFGMDGKLFSSIYGILPPRIEFDYGWDVG